MNFGSDLGFGKSFGKLFAAIGWGIGAMVLGGLLAGWEGATIALCVMCYWRMCVMTMAAPLIIGFTKTIEKFEKRQTINQALVQDLEEMREKFNGLREEFDDFQLGLERKNENKKKKNKKN